MKEMTEEEAKALSEHYIQHPARVDPKKNGGFAKKSFRMGALDRLAEDYLFTRAIAEHKTPSEIISDMVREKVSAVAYGAGRP
jgi:DNA recombination-dependent growth factor C